MSQSYLSNIVYLQQILFNAATDRSVFSGTALTQKVIHQFNHHVLYIQTMFHFDVRYIFLNSRGKQLDPKFPNALIVPTSSLCATAA